MAVISFCLGAASVVAAAYVHKYYEDSRTKKTERLHAALTAVHDGADDVDKDVLDELYRKGWVADVADGRAVTAAGREFLEKRNGARPS